MQYIMRRSYRSHAPLRETEKSAAAWMRTDSNGYRDYNTILIWTYLLFQIYADE